MVMPVYESEVVDDEEHGRNQTWAKTEKALSPGVCRGAQRLYGSRSHRGDGIKNAPTWLEWGAAKPLGVSLYFL